MLALGFAGAIAGLEGPPERLGRRLECERAQIVDGELRCDGELIAGCPGGGAPGAGDAVQTKDCAVARMDPEQLAALGQPVDVQTASAEELASLPGIGPALAGRIIAGRPYASVDELERVKGIGPKRLAAMRARARVSSTLRPPSR
jgi:DNA uptake protein ComE-like DNA-binding protein